jgi:hypothetical protein
MEIAENFRKAGAFCIAWLAAESPSFKQGLLTRYSAGICWAKAYRCRKHLTGAGTELHSLLPFEQQLPSSTSQENGD